jgi:protein TonB
VNAATPYFPLQVSTDWYRQPSVKVAFVVSLLAHAGGILLLPGLRVPVPSEPPPMIVELAPMPEPVVASPPPVPEPKPALAPRPPPPPVKEKPPEPPPEITRVVPQPEAPPEMPVQPQPEPRPEPKPQPVPEPRVEAPPPVVQPRPEPPPAAIEPPAKAAAPAPTPSASDPGLLKAYGNVLAQAIGQRKNYPRLARMRNWQGTTELKLQIGADAKLTGLTITHSSGYDLLDQQAITMVKETLPLPELPAALRGKEFAVTVPVVFKLQ